MTVGVDYLDITAEINTYRLAERLGPDAATAGVMLLPGVGWDVVPTDCLAAQVVHGASQHRRRFGIATPGRGLDVTRIGDQRGQDRRCRDSWSA